LDEISDFIKEGLEIILIEHITDAIPIALRKTQGSNCEQDVSDGNLKKSIDTPPNPLYNRWLGDCLSPMIKIIGYV